jgi:hypothetical protein
MITKDEALKMAIDVIQKWSDGGGDECMAAIKACEEALEQPEPFISFNQKEWMSQIGEAYRHGYDEATRRYK